MNPIQTYSFQNRPVRVAGSPEKTLFCAADVCTVLETISPRQTLSTFPDDEKYTLEIDSDGGKQSLTFITELGLCRLIFRSNKSWAEPFRCWMFHVILPSIRKAGRHRALGASTLDCFDLLIKAAREQERRLDDCERRINGIESSSPSSISSNSPKTGFFTVSTYARLRGVCLSRYWTARLGQRATKFCRDHGILKGKTKGTSFNKLNTYPIEVLDSVWATAFQKGDR